MILLVVFAFLAGVVTILSPCILPVLPIILISGITGGNASKSRPLGVVCGFILSFTFFTLLLSTLVHLSGIPSGLLRILSILLVAGFGTSLLVPQFQVILEQLFSRLTGNSSPTQNKIGFGGGVLIGLSLGLLWTPCVGPILASVISLAVSGTVTLDTFLITFSYSLGTAIPMFIVMLGGQNVIHRIPGLLSHLPQIQKVFGLVMILTAIAISLNLDRKFQSFITSSFPNYGIGLTKFEDNPLIRAQLNKNAGLQVTQDDMGKPLFDLLKPKATPAPALVPGGEWFNSSALNLSDLKGKVVIIDFWTYTCINCQRTLPYLESWYEKYKAADLVIIGVHSPEFEFEKDSKNVARAIKDFKITYPVVQDNNFSTWKAYSNSYWPAKYFIDKDGFIRYTHFGEGEYDKSEQVIQELLKEAGATDISNKINNPMYQNNAQTPEMYLGYKRLQYFSSPEKIVRDSIASYSSPTKLNINQLSYEGNWKVMSEYANPQPGSKLHLNFNAQKVFLVMRPAKGSSKVTVYLDNQIQKTITVDADKLYTMVELSVPGYHLLRLEFEDSNTEVYAFTFG